MQLVVKVKRVVSNVRHSQSTVAVSSWYSAVEKFIIDYRLQVTYYEIENKLLVQRNRLGFYEKQDVFIIAYYVL